MDIETLLGFPPETEHDVEILTKFTPENIEYFRRQCLRMKFMCGQVEPNYDYPQAQAIEIARHQAMADVYSHLIDVAEAQLSSAEVEQTRLRESPDEDNGTSETFF